MSNILGENRFFLILRSFSLKNRLFITISIFGLLTFLLFIFFYYPTNFLFNKQYILFEDLNKQEVLLNKILNDINVLESRNNILLNDYNDKLNHNFIFKDRINFLLAEIKNNSLKCIEFKSIEKKKNISYKKNYYDLKIQGDFKNIIALLTDSNQVFDTLKFKNIIISNKDSGEILFYTQIRDIKFLGDNVKI